ncbi:hypothetical protein NG821_09980 [Prevotella cerevisiae]|uniref:Uncharacterized protein n=1 Tax=Segatella cerevisiae TaxID=2053716 RepID=A0ABT1C0Z1_9BACT|nr:hypothetical protein [Segatella cerevisiae]MCO6026163.1 hypothetical protein [Segatella cerevisiae]
MSSQVNEMSNRNGSLLRGLVIVSDLLLLNVYTWVYTEVIGSLFTRIKSFWLTIWDVISGKNDAVYFLRSNRWDYYLQ